MRKLVIQIPCLDEEETLPQTLAPCRVGAGHRRVEWLVVDDGSTDATAEVARGHGVDQVVRLAPNQGLARAFTAGLEALLSAAPTSSSTPTPTTSTTPATSEPGAADPGPASDMVIGDATDREIEHSPRSRSCCSGSGSWAVAIASAPRPRCAQRLSRHQPRRGAAAERVLRLHLHARDHHPGRAQEHRGRPPCRCGSTARLGRRGWSRASRYMCAARC